MVLLLSSVICVYSTEVVLGDLGIEYVELEDVQKHDRCVKYEQLVMELVKLDFIHNSSEKKHRTEIMKSAMKSPWS